MNKLTNARWLQICTLIMLLSILACQTASPHTPTPPPEAIPTQDVQAQPDEPEEPLPVEEPVVQPTDQPTAEEPPPVEEPEVQPEPEPLDPVPAGETHTAAAVTDGQGIAQFADALSGNTLVIEFKDDDSQNPLPGIEVWFASNGPQVLVIARDPAGEYGLVVKELSYDQLALLPGAYKLAAPSQQAGISLGTVILMAKALQLYQDITEWKAYLDQFPELENWTTKGVSLCMNPLQVGEGEKMILQGVLGLVPFGNNPITEGLMIVAEEAVLDEAADQMVVELFEEPKAIFSITLISFNGLLPRLIRFDGYCLDWLDQTDPQSVMDWLIYGLDNQDMYALSAITGDGDIVYANYLEGGQVIDRQTYLEHLGTRLPGGSTCEGYSTSPNRIEVWTSGWSPAWQMTEYCYIECNPISPPYESPYAAFFLQARDGEWGLRGMYLNTPENLFFTDDYVLTPCSKPVEVVP